MLLIASFFISFDEAKCQKTQNVLSMQYSHINTCCFSLNLKNKNFKIKIPKMKSFFCFKKNDQLMPLHIRMETNSEKG